MKKLTLIAVAMLLVTNVFAQNGAQFGVKGGLTMAQEMAGEGSTEVRVGIHAGFFVETQLGRMTDFQPEILYSMQGGGGDQLDYVIVPLMFKFYTGQARRFSIDVGPQLGYMVRANMYYDRLNKFEASLGLGVTYKLNGGFDLVFRGTGGLTKIWDGSEHRNSVAHFGVGYRF